MQYFPTFDKMTKHKEVVAFTCGLLPDPSHLVDHAYTMFINLTILRMSFSYVLDYKHKAVLLESLYRESNIPLHGHHFQNQFINLYGLKDFYGLIPSSFDRIHANHPIYRPSRVFIFLSHTQAVELGEMNKNNDITDSKIFIRYTTMPVNLFRTCCRISEDQPIAQLFMEEVLFTETREPCTMRISKNNFRITMHLVYMLTHLMVHLMEPISQSSRVDFVELETTSLIGVKSFNLENKAASMLHLCLFEVKMEKDLCASILKQILSLTKLKYLIIRSLSRGGPSFSFTLQEYCHIPRDKCPEILRSISHFHHLVHLDVSGNNLTGCLSNLVSDTYSRLPLLQKVVFGEHNLKFRWC